MRAAIYARKSTDQTAVADENKSVTRQAEHARAYAVRKGWQVLDEHIYIDDGISGAEFANRPGFVRVMNALTPRPRFDVLIMSEESRLGREAIETAYALKRIISAGVRVFFYLEDRERTLQSPTDKLLMSVTAFADELERERARQRTFDALARKARAGHVTGGRVFGYDNVDVAGPDGRRTHVERRVNAGEASVVRRVFELAAGGLGQKQIARDLNAAGALTPRAQRGRPTAWAPSSVHEVLHRDLYRGQVIWNRSRKRDAWGRTRPHARAEADWIRHEDPALQIVPETLWVAVHDRLRRRRAQYRTDERTRPVGPRQSPYLLSGFAECGCCHGRLTVRTHPSGRHRYARLACWYYTTRGRTICTNKWAAPLDAIDALVLDTIEQDLLAPEVVEHALVEAAARLETDDEARLADGQRVTRELAQIDLEAERLTALTAAGVGDLPAVINRLRQLQARRQQIMARLASGSLPAQGQRHAASLQDLRARLDDWRGLLRSNMAEARGVLEQVLGGRIVLTPRRDSPTLRPVFDVQIPLTLQGVVEGILLPRTMASPTGFEPVF